ncbi:MAG TPA: glycosyltransferase family 10 [Chlamydiales bacterium]|nr:glycosyltransferase family 10 [Chlamydiales bacterium]
MDWKSDAKGQEIFVDDSLPGKIRKEFLAHQWDIRSWECEKYRPWLLNFKEVHSWNDFLNWMGFGLSRKNPVEENKQWVFWSLGPKLKNFDFRRAPKEKMVLFMWEPEVVQPESHDPEIHKCFGKIFTWDDDLVDNVKYFKFHYPVWGERIEHVTPFEEKKFCTLINGRLCSKHPKQLYGEREKMIRFFEDKDGEFDLYGKYWEKRNYKNYRGAIGDKIAVLKNYKFCICYENTKDVRGYVTEKIFDCFKAGVVPVYLGASNICDYVPKECFVDRREFKDDQAVYDFLKNMNQEMYAEYLMSAENFLKSEKSTVFSENYFIETFLQMYLN